MFMNEQSDEDYSDLITKISKNIQQLSQYVQKLINKSQRDGESDSGDMQLLTSNINKCSKETNLLMKELVDASNLTKSANLKVQRERLMNDLISILNRYQNAQRNLSNRKKQSLQQYEQVAQQTDHQAYQPVQNEERSKMTQLQIDQGQYINEIKERNESMKQLDSDIDDIKQIMTDLARIVHDQGEFVDSIEASVEHAAIFVQQGSTEMRAAIEYQRKALKKKFILSIFLILLALIVVLVVYFYFDK